MMKIIGIAIISVSILLTGMGFYEKYNLRPKSLGIFIELLTVYSNDLKLYRKSLSEVIRSLDTSDDYLKECKRLIHVRPLYEAAVTDNIYFDKLFLSKDDKIILTSFFEKAGKSVLNEESLLCQKTIRALEIQREQASEEMKKMGPLSLKLGAIVGVLAAIILI